MTAHPQPRSRRRLATLSALFLLALAALPALGGTKPAASAKSAGHSVKSAARAPYATSTASDPLAQRLCAALHTLPEERKAQCCSVAPASTLAGQCARTLTAALHDRALRLDPTAIDHCAADSSQTFSGCDWVTPLVPRSPDSCASAVRGLAPAGASCRSSLECQDGLFCRGTGSATGVCAQAAPPGSACGGSIDTLATVLRAVDLASRHPECTGYCLAGRCAAFSPPGAACLSSRQCAPGQHCGDGTCSPGAVAALGEACTGTSCGPDASCQGGRCAPLKHTGSTCTSPFECKGACLMATGATSGTCGMKCSNWPLPPTQGEISPAAAPPSNAPGKTP